MRRKLIVCYVPGLDQRLISAAGTPAIADLQSTYAPVTIRTIPDTELVPTLLSGVYPHQNKVWQVSLGARRPRTLVQRIVDGVPDLVSTTLQCIRQRFSTDFDLATIPPRRRREFTQHRFKYTRRAANPETLTEFNGYETLFGVLGEQSRYRFTSDLTTLDALAQEVLESPIRLEFIEMYGLDLYQHWHLDNEAGMAHVLAETDRFVATLRDGCSERDCTLLLLSDHGQEPVVGTIPLVQALNESGVSIADYSYYCTLACCRFWFHTNQARERILASLHQLPNCQALHFREMHDYDVCFDDDSFGEYYLMADPGYVFFPHDFYHPVANLYLGLLGNSQGNRISNPVHRGNHGYLPHHPSEKGFLVLADDELGPTREEMSLIDFAPTALRCLGADVPPHMAGQSVVA